MSCGLGGLGCPGPSLGWGGRQLSLFKMPVISLSSSLPSPPLFTRCPCGREPTALAGDELSLNLSFLSAVISVRSTLEQGRGWGADHREVRSPGQPCHTGSQPWTETTVDPWASGFEQRSRPGGSFSLSQPDFLTCTKGVSVLPVEGGGRGSFFIGSEPEPPAVPSAPARPSVCSWRPLLLPSPRKQPSASGGHLLRQLGRGNAGHGSRWQFGTCAQ